MSKKIALNSMIDLSSKDAIEFRIGPLAWIFLSASKRGNAASDMNSAYFQVMELVDSVAFHVVENSDEGVFPSELEPGFISLNMKLSEMLELLAALDWSKLTLTDAFRVLDDLDFADLGSKEIDALCKPAEQILQTWFIDHKDTWAEYRRKDAEDAAKKQKDRQAKIERDAIAVLKKAGYSVLPAAGVQTPSIGDAKPKKAKGKSKKS